MPADPPELATNEERAAAVAAREAKGLSQREVGQKVGTSQNVVSLIESGKVESSSFVLPISRLLGISPPQFHESDEQRQWVELGHLLRSKDPRIWYSQTPIRIASSRRNLLRARRRSLQDRVMGARVVGVERRWVAAGDALRERSPETFARLLAILQAWAAATRGRLH